MKSKQNVEKEVKVHTKVKPVGKIIRRSSSSRGSFNKDRQVLKSDHPYKNSLDLSLRDLGLTDRNLGSAIREQFSKGTRFLGLAFNVMNEKSQNKNSR